MAGMEESKQETPPSHVARPTAQAVQLTINGVGREAVLHPFTTLLEALRGDLGLPGTKRGCGAGACGACTVLLDGRRIKSCLTLAAMCEESKITTIEGLSVDDRLHPLQQAFIEHDALQCGYCTPGQILSAAGYLAECHGPGEPADHSGTDERQPLPLRCISEHRCGDRLGRGGRPMTDQRLYVRPQSWPELAPQAREGAAYIAGGTEMIPLMREGIVSPSAVIDLRGLIGAGIEASAASPYHRRLCAPE